MARAVVTEIVVDRGESPRLAVPRQWSAVPIGPGSVQLRWDQMPLPPYSLRLALAVDTRDQYAIEVALPTGRVGIIDVRYGYAYQVHELAIPEGIHAAIIEHGLTLTQLAGPEPMWIFDDLGQDPTRSAFAPHLQPHGDSTLSVFVDSVLSLDSLQPFGWLEGCVLEGQHALRHVVGEVRADEAIERHLAQYFVEDDDLVYETLHGERLVNSFGTIEALLPFAQVVRLHPEHPILGHVVDYVTRIGPAAITGGTTTAEGAYTVAYPLARLGAETGQRQWIDRAFDELLLRTRELPVPGGLRQRNRPCGRGHWYRNWARGHAWYLLGLVRVIEIAEQVSGVDATKLDQIRTAFVEMASTAASYCGPDGLWSCFIDTPDTAVETSGSAGIAAALAVGTRLGLGDWQRQAIEAQRGLVDHLTPDGLLGGVSQHNAGGETLQRSGYRVHSQMGMGLMAQLVGELGHLGAAAKD